ncbi:MAG: nicotinate-nucleotide--dimethylbenzimidazole phosphoribosyltransferase [Lachnospiraceae bacterium]|nr:nicotinate-nucleotide--dimethylbenzimidazole phosphoribosyltransferase [Lachnospiraceae bacterium]
MEERDLQKIIEAITPGDMEAADVCRRRWDSIAKPLHSLGWLEDTVARIAAAQHSPEIQTQKKILVPMCADNGIVAEGVTQTGQEVTAIVAENFLDEQSCAAIMCRLAGADIRPIDIGMVTDTPRVEKRKVAYGTRNFAKEPAMTREEAVQALMVGITLAGELKEQGYDLIATGEMGIGNTTTSSAVASALLGVPAVEMTGRGAGLSTEGLNKKIRVIQEALERYGLTGCPNGSSADSPTRGRTGSSADTLSVLSCVGGFDVAGIAGLFLGGAYHHIPVLIDGFISSVGALLAVRLCPAAGDYMIATHVSKEPAARRILKELALEPALDAGMCLGEGSGAVAAFPLIDMGAEIYHRMSTFEQIQVEAYQELI